MRIATISPDRCFVTSLAEGLWERAAGDPLALSRMQLFLPTRRSCRALRDAFLRATGARAALLPRMQPLGDVDEVELDFAGSGSFLDQLPPAIPPLRRQLLLTRLIRQKDGALPWDQACSLASALASLLDQMQMEGRGWEDLKTIVPQDYAEHWQETLNFLDIVTCVWPDVLKAEGCMDPAARRVAMLTAQARQWQEVPPEEPVLIAGSTGSIPAVGALMGVVARSPKGEVILPALDLAMDEEAWQAADETHPQYTMKTWLEREGFKRTDVAIWQELESPRPQRVRFMREAMRPAAVTEVWRDLGPQDMPPAATEGVALLEMDHQREEADVIALRLRAALEVDGQTAALVTPDRALAARVAASLSRWGIEADDSAGQSLSLCGVGSFLLAILDAAQPDAGAIDYLALLKHPLAALGEEPAACRAKAREVETHIWRGVRRTGGMDGAIRALRPDREDLAQWMEALAKAFAPLLALGQQSFASMMQAHRDLAERLAATSSETGANRLWRGMDGEAAVAWFDDLAVAAADFPEVKLGDYARLVRILMDGVTVRPSFGRHPRLNLLGPLEARLIHHDVVVLGGLNEGTWPPAPSVDPWLSRPMKRDLKLPTPERRVGLSAHDFVGLACGPQVLVTRSRRVGGAPTVPSRFLLAMGAVLQAARGNDSLPAAQPWRNWARALDEAPVQLAMAPPRPCPPVSARPTELHVTDIGTWQRNPYALYAKRILKLYKLDDIDADVSVADKGDMIHSALENFVRLTMAGWPHDPLALALEEGRKAFAPFADRPQVMAFWWPRFERIARWFVDELVRRRQEGTMPAAVEEKGGIALCAGAFHLSGRVDRIDRNADGTLEIIDYKTGAAPTKTMVYAGYEPQLPLLAMIAENGGFERIGPAPASSLSYWELRGGKESEKVTTFATDVDGLVERARDGLEKLVETFSNPDTPYEAVPKPRYAPRYDDYAHLARLAEWGRVDGGDE